MAEMENQVWQPLPGVENVQIFPFLRKVDIISSNSYLVAAPGLLVVVDPGGLTEQADILAGEISRLLAEKPRPVLVCLTHVHLDHCLQLLRHPVFQTIPHCKIAVQEQGALALETGDRAATIADLIQQDLTMTDIDIHLLPGRDEAMRFEGESHDEDISCISHIDSLPLEGGVNLMRQSIPLHGESVIEFFPTPGHSPDSICIRMGEVLFIGDLAFATAPGVAGLKGWDLEALVTSLDNVTALLSHGGISVCLPGHGRPLDSPMMLRTLAAMKKEAARLEGIESINPEWVKETAAYAGDLMDEVDRLFTIIAGRLVYVAHVLDELEESGEADRLRGMIDSDLVDELLSDFNRFSLEYHSGQVLEIHVALKANQISQKLERIYSGEVLGSILDLSLVLRVERLLLDYTLTFRGFRPHVDLEATDISIAAGEVASALSCPHYRDESIIEAESEEEFARALALRIAYVNPFENLEIIYNPGKDLPLALMDRGRFSDLLQYIFEKISAAGATRFTLTTGSFGGNIQITIQCTVSPSAFNERVRQFIAKSSILSGGTCTLSPEGDGLNLTLQYPAVNRSINI